MYIPSAPTNVLRALIDLAKHRYLISQLVRREVLVKYRGSLLGIGWSFLYPLLLLLAFTLVFGGVFGGRWSGTEDTRSGIEMALFIYCGLAVFMPFSEVITSSPRLLSTNQNFIKKIIFPVEILPLVAVLTALIHGSAHLLLLAIAALLAGHGSAAMLLAPLVLLPVWLFTLGAAWLLTAAGAYVRDLAHGMPVLAQFLMFVLPVFYPATAAPGVLRVLNTVNPLALAIDDVRLTLLQGRPPAWGPWWTSLLVCGTITVAGYAFFMRCREEFADVV
jgi:lipopolysaccharide transport system permease protein